MTMAAYQKYVERLFNTMRRAKALFEAAGIEYRIVGGLAVLLHVAEVDPELARNTNDVDVAIERAALDRLAELAPAHGFEYRHVARTDMLVDTSDRRARSAIHMIFVGEKVRPEYVEPVPDFDQAVRTADGVLLAPVASLVRMKLTSFRLKDQVHIQDMDGAGLITPDIEAGLSGILRSRLAQVRASE